MDIVAFLTARLDEREQLARHVQHAVGDQFDALMGVLGEAHEPGWRYGIVPLYLRSHDPARVLAEVEAVRGVIAIYSRFAADYDRLQAAAAADSFAVGQDQMTIAAVRVRALEGVLTELAAPYSAHTDYNPAWAD